MQICIATKCIVTLSIQGAFGLFFFVLLNKIHICIANSHTFNYITKEHEIRERKMANIKKFENPKKITITIETETYNRIKQASQNQSEYINDSIRSSLGSHSSFEMFTRMAVAGFYICDVNSNILNHEDAQTVVAAVMNGVDQEILCEMHNTLSKNNGAK